MPQGVKSPILSAAEPIPCSPARRLRRFLQAYWLRPENALWMALRSEVLSPYELHRSPQKKKDVWEDMKVLLGRMGKPVPQHKTQ